MLDCAYSGFEPSYNTAVGQTLNIIIPTVDTTQVTNIGNGAIAPTLTEHTMTSIVLATKQSTSFSVQNFDQVRTPLAMKELYIGPRLEALLRVVDADLLSTLIAGFTVNTAVAGTGGSFTRSQLASAKSALDRQGTPSDDMENMFLITHSDVYNKMTADPAFSQNYYVGAEAAISALEKGILMPALGARLKKDQQFPLGSGGAYYGLLMHRYALGVRYAIEPKLADDNFLKEVVIYPKPGLPVKIQTWNDPSTQGIKVHLSCVYGRAVTRAAFGVVLTA